MNYFDLSMMYERKFADVTAKLYGLTRRITLAEDRAKETGEKVNPALYTEKETLSRMRNFYRKMSDNAFVTHRNKIRARDLNDEGTIRLAVAIMELAASDYEKAISKDNAEQMKRIERFGRDTGERSEEIFSRIKSDAAKFKEKAENEIDAILATTMDINGRPGNHDYCNKSLNKNRCPLCGGGMYVRNIHKVKDRIQYKVMCTGCNLSTVVEREV